MYTLLLYTYSVQPDVCMRNVSHWSMNLSINIGGSESLFFLTPLDRIRQTWLLSVNGEYDRSATVPGPLVLSRLSGRPPLFIHICFTFFLLNN